MTEPLSAAEETRREDLATTARELKKEVGDLRGEVSNLRVRAERLDRRSGLAGLFIVGLILAAVWLAIVSYQTSQTSARVEAITQRALCPMYALVLGGYDPSTRELNPDGSYEGSARQKYVTNFEGPDGLFSQRAGLPCIGPLTPPRSDG